jgi:hypothetical protein
MRYRQIVPGMLNNNFSAQADIAPAQRAHRLQQKMTMRGSPLASGRRTGGGGFGRWLFSRSVNFFPRR